MIGTSDMGGRGVPARRPVPAPGRSRPPLPASPPTEAGRAQVAASQPKAGAELELRAVHPAKPAQEEFGFGEVESRGHFEKTDRNLFDGQDLDVPTYLRKGIKIVF